MADKERDSKGALSFRFSHKQLEALAAMAEKLDVKKAKLLRMALSEFFKKHHEEWPMDSE